MYCYLFDPAPPFDRTRHMTVNTVIFDSTTRQFASKHNIQSDQLPNQRVQSTGCLSKGLLLLVLVMMLGLTSLQFATC